ncbi:MAG: SDR family oxidoreductase [Ostreibacterium sp.]
MYNLKEKNAMITGGAQGIGKAIAEHFAELGANIGIADINFEQAKKTAYFIEKRYDTNAIAIPMDVSCFKEVEKGYLAFKAQFGNIQILVNNAGINVFHEPLNMMENDWEKCMSVDLEGAWNCCKMALKDMLEQQYGSIVNIISNHSFTVIKDTFPYPVAKHALLGLTRSLALQYADQGITVNAISPGYTDTALAQSVFDATDNPEKTRKEIEKKQPPKRLCKPSEIAAVAALLASDEARFIVGENIVIDGGVSIRMYE